MTGRSKWLRLLAIIGVAVIGLAACDSEEQTAEDQSVDAAGDDTGDDPAAQDDGDDGATDDPYGGGGDTDSAKDEKTDDAAGASAGAVEIEGFAFTDTEAAPGTTVTVENKDSTAHTLTADDGEFDTGEIDGDGSAEFTAPAEPGEYAFHCEIHPSMTGTLTVA